MGLAKRIIPCLDVDAGRVVKGVQFVDIRDAGDPVEIAKRYNDAGADEITFLDITASHQERDTTLHTVEQIASQVFIPLTVGGGVRAGVRGYVGATALGCCTAVRGALRLCVCVCGCVCVRVFVCVCAPQPG